MPMTKAIACLLGFGLSVAFIISSGKVLVGDAGVSPLVLVALQNTAAGVILVGMAWPAAATRRRLATAFPFFVISAISGIAAPHAIAFIVAPHLGAAVTSMTYLFPPLLTFAFALGLGMERYDVLGLSGLALGLVGGALLFWGESVSAAERTAWLALALTAPLLQAAGNIYRSKFWPPDIPLIPLTAAIVGLSGLLGGALALIVGEPLSLPALQSEHWFLLAGCIACATFGYLLFFYLQREAGPVYVSQGGYVIATFGILSGALIFGETLPIEAIFGALTVGAGIVLYTVRLRFVGRRA